MCVFLLYDVVESQMLYDKCIGDISYKYRYLWHMDVAYRC